MQMLMPTQPKPSDRTPEQDANRATVSATAAATTRVEARPAWRQPASGSEMKKEEEWASDCLTDCYNR